MENQTNKTTVKSMTLRSMYEKKVFTAVSKLRFNSTGYGFLTFLNNGKAVNVYFSKNSGLLVKDNFAEGTDLIQNGVLSNAQIIEVTNAEQQQRFKISIPKAESEYVDTSSLEAAFGTSVATEFDLEGFKSTFTSSADSAVKINQEEATA